ncbi:hypothetical protein [Frondihabitans australicus]|uniref:Uncharacterized protein n=1 Tax=Frondihabitans australicus TaxID=386892 RepID=A0A495IBA5_9MICO|nr:hypothetical protein [Frondihabitans australicus]RKR73283.1 hypothetical protein C8E83_0373 [Frondihabitans australicus]
MTEPGAEATTGDDGRQVSRRRPPQYWLLIVLITAEFLAVAGVTIGLVVELFATRPTSYAAGIAVIVMAIVAAVWLAFIVAGALRGRAWIRGASFVWQVLQFAIGIGCFQGLTATPVVGWLLVVPAVVVAVLLMLPSVRAVTGARG